jgi:ribose 5-phosphate isomerase
MFLFSRKESHKLGEKYKRGIPVEVIPMASCPVQQKIEAMYGGTAELRMGKMKAVCGLMFKFVIVVCCMEHILDVTL